MKCIIKDCASLLLEYNGLFLEISMYLDKKISKYTAKEREIGICGGIV